MTTTRLGFGCGLSVAYLLLAPVASAQDSATAGALFEKGVADMEAGHFDSACPAIEESQRIDPRPGTLFTLAECHAHWGKVASAAAQYQEYVDLVSRLTPDQRQRHQARADIARAQISKLKPTVPTLTLVLPANAPPGTFVTRNGEVLKGAALGLPLPVDPGEYLIVTHVPGMPDRETKVSIQLAEAKRVPLDTTQVASEPAATLAPSPSPLPSSPSVAVPPEPSAAGGAARSSGRKTAAYVAGGLGIAGIAVGSITGVLVFSKKHTVSGNCVGASCNSAGLDAASSGKSLAIVSDIGFGVGIAGLALATVLLFTGGSEATEARRTSWQPVLVGGNGVLATGLSRRW